MRTLPAASSANFTFLRQHDVQLERLGALAERYFRDDPNTCLIKIRQFGELLAQLVAAKAGRFTSPDEPQTDLLRRLSFERVLPREVGDLFHQVRISGNKATHAHAGDHSEALTSLKIARQLGVWFHRTFADRRFRPGMFVPPQDPVAVGAVLQTELDRLRAELDEHRSAAERAQIAAEEQAQARQSAEERAQQEREERSVWEKLAEEADTSRAALAAELAALQTAAAQAAPQEVAALIEQAQSAAQDLDIDEAATRALIDEQLRARGWEVETPSLRFSAGTRPARGRNLAIAEWPTVSGPADYALFIGTRCIAVVEAKRRNKNVSAHIDQAQRYARGFRFEGGAEAIAGPWPDGEGAEFHVPFVFSANGRPYLRQLETQSGIWFRDTRKATHHRRALIDWPTPDGLRGMLDIDVEAAHADLRAHPIEFGFPLRPYQKRAIEVVEAELERDRRTMLLAMATGTGKTKLAIAMLYRLLSAKRFRRVCFVVDRNALGNQAAGEFETTRIVSAKTFADIFGLKGLGTVTPEPETKVHICTIQGLVKRVLYPAFPE
jgi:type I restriction enzyme R subunit